MLQEVGIEKLRYAVVVQTIQDYVASLKYLHLPKSRQTEEEAQGARETIQDCEQFFCSNWFTVLLDMDGPCLMRAIRHMAYSRNGIVGLEIP